MLLTAPESNVKQGVTSTVEDNYATNIFNFFITVFYPSPFSSGKEQRQKYERDLKACLHFLFNAIQLSLCIASSVSL